ncbi:PspA/IM30 family protein [Calothrix sp. CCY 0018]|uniref:PspA/IM30 family protein n=1 Tax=Calothrix sp. CCY 0018 TaxID=3103864 RepID=UPI0039C64B1C
MKHYNQMNVQQDKLEKLRATQKDFEKAQAKAKEWAKVHQLALKSNRDDLISRAAYKKQRCEEIASRLKNIINEQASQLDQVKTNFSYYQNQISETRKNITTGAAFIAAGTIAGANLSPTIGGMGLVGSFGGIGIGAAHVVCAGAITGAAAYGAMSAIEGDRVAISAIAIGSVGGAGVSSLIGTMGLVAPKIGLAVGIGTIPMAAVGGVVGLAAYGVAKMLSKTSTSKAPAIGETPIQAFERMEEKILEMDFYTAAKQELQEFLSGKDLNPQFATLEIEDELQTLKKQLLNGLY